MEFSLELHFTIQQEDDQFVASCDEFDIASHGNTVEEALQRCQDAVVLYVEVLSEDGELDRVLKERGVVRKASTVYRSEPQMFSTTSHVLVGAH